MTPFESADFDHHEAVHFFSDAPTGLEAIVAIHSSALGPAAGGCRYWSYPSASAALTDALRLSRGMSYKNALAGLPLGGGKAVILKRPGGASPALFEALGRAIESLGGRYITAEDVGTTVADLQQVARATRYVSGLSAGPGVVGGDPSPSTALGVFLGLQAGWRYLTRRELAGVRVAVQGLGAVGYGLCDHLHRAGARLLIADLATERVERAVRAFGAKALPVDQILTSDADIIAPCALGAVLNAVTIPKLTARLIAGAANNQLATGADGERLRQRGILYAPDYVLNAGGIISVACEYFGERSAAELERRIRQIPGTLLQVFEQAAAESLPTSEIADRMARERLARGRRGAAVACNRIETHRLPT